jgi:hypothetical protein
VWAGFECAYFTVINEVKQDGVLSPFLFCVYVDDQRKKTFQFLYTSLFHRETLAQNKTGKRKKEKKYNAVNSLSQTYKTANMFLI